MNNIHLHILGSELFCNLLRELDLNYKINLSKNYKNNDQHSVISIIFPEKLQLPEVKKYISKDIPIVFLLNNKDYFKKNNLVLQNFHTLLTLPVEIISFKEILNILVTKYNFFKNSKIIVNNYEIDSNQRIIIKKDKKIKITEKELELILTLNKNNGLSKSSLLKSIWNHNLELDSHAFETHLHRLRKKINKYFKDKNFIIEKNSQYYLSK
jgi:DNA-binding response OmpR family regulator